MHVIPLETAYLRATNTVNAFCAFAPNTFLKKRLATVTPDDLISSFDAALRCVQRASALLTTQSHSPAGNNGTHAK